MRHLLVALLAITALLFASTNTEAALLKVPGDEYPDIVTAAAAAKDGDTILVSAGTYGGDILLENVAGVTLRGKGDVVVDGAGLGVAIYGLGCENLTVEEITFTGCAKSAVCFEDCAGLRFRKNVVLDACEGLITMNCDDMRVERNTFRDLQGSGVIDRDSARALIQKNDLHDLGGIGIYTTQEEENGVHGARILKNRIARCTSWGTYSYGLGNSLEKNRIEACLSGIFMDDSSTNTGARVRSNVVSDCQEGIMLRGLAMLAERNRVSGSGSGITIRSVPWLTVNGGSGTASTVKSNRMTGIGGISILLEGHEHHAESNSITDAGDAGVVVDGTDCQVLKNRLNGGAGDGIRLGGLGCQFIPSDSRIEGNSVKGFTGNGIVIYDGIGQVIRKNRAVGNGDGESTFDLRDYLPEGQNEYEKNTFGTTHFGSNGM